MGAEEEEEEEEEEEADVKERAADATLVVFLISTLKYPSASDIGETNPMISPM